MATKKKDQSPSSPNTHVLGSQDDESRGAWWRPSGWKLRNKIALALAFPMIAASWFAVDRSVDEYALQQDQQETAGQVRVLEPTIEYLYAAQDATVIARTEKDAESPARLAAVEAVRTSAEELEKSLDDENLTANQQAQLEGILALSSELRDGRAYVTLLQSLSQVRQLHNGVSDFYQSIINGQTTQEPALAQLTHVMEGRLAFTMQQLQIAYSGNRITNSPQVFSFLGVEEAAIAQLARARDDEPMVLDLRARNSSRFDTVESGRGELASTETLDLYGQLTDSVVSESNEALSANAADAQSKATSNIVILAVVLITTLILAWLIARLILRPLQRLRDGARAVASDKLPRAVATIRGGGDPGEIEPLDVHTNEEMGQLARAVDELHQTAVNLASGEAKLRGQVGEMFVTLSRRNTSLINQQLGLIEELERDEQDPRRLESLFRLDHLAARMRRTAESLVILSDAPVRQREGQALTVNDTLQAATAGVQEYQRIEMRGASTDKIVGAAANDVVHLLTELMDNALSFSPPTETVHVSTTGAPGQTIIAIADGGLGMPDDVMSQLNRMLRSDVGITPDAARRMGLFVVSRLAQRHQIDVELTRNSRGGVTATVTLSDRLLVGGAGTMAPAAATPTPAPAVPAQEESFAAPVIPAAAADPEPVSPAPVDHDPLTAPLDAAALAAEAKPSPVEDVKSAQGNAPSAPVTGLPQRRPGATVPGREAAVQPTGGSLFAPAEPVSMFERPVADEAEVDETPAAPKTELKPLGIFSRRDALAEAQPEPESAPLDTSDELADAPAVPVEEADSESTLPEPATQVTEVEEPAAEAEPEPEPEPESTVAEISVEERIAAATAAGADPLGLDLLKTEEPAVDRAADPDADADADAVNDEPVPAADEPAADEPDTGSEEAEAAEEAPVTYVTAPAISLAPETPQTPAIFSAPETPPTPQSPAEPVRRGSHAAAVDTKAPAPASQESSTPLPKRAARAASGDGSASNWLAAQGAPASWGSHADAGWKAAGEATAADAAAPVSNTGLPMRQPGRRLVPGSVAPTAKAPTRDPEAIKKRLAAHAAGVSRGRSATATPLNNDKEGPA
ncbi:ATP-binding protein [Nocardioides gilvus]|uniref:ATP-binding protein n=1 Tax=Nocardioides gilvus TaxID=1735589 RepID=UPI000D744306|nr:ATP-binding protein [Nocardioides gilvus]